MFCCYNTIILFAVFKGNLRYRKYYDFFSRRLAHGSQGFCSSFCGTRTWPIFGAWTGAPSRSERRALRSRLPNRKGRLLLLLLLFFLSFFSLFLSPCPKANPFFFCQSWGSKTMIAFKPLFAASTFAVEKNHGSLL